ncbi:trypsin-like peptidase domain-containing protein [Actinomadura decatromicini]|uniref:Trypsin-like serine protease n=1 Tax=Actinomadura decatromicini TaxID=2604572 RepID=A0A5D3F894_9ACTN|nr:trypsin-like peptidase domain-containing protein [Actinomadura decatromicini]TYK44124.1 trypsin-like serine protease [Actinomadura decatromicini]
MTGPLDCVVAAAPVVCRRLREGEVAQGEEAVPRGSGVLVDPTHVLTAAHVLKDCAGSKIGLRFDGLPMIRARRVELGPEAAPENLDVALLELDHAPPGVAPVALWPVGRLPDKVHLFGYPEEDPRAEGAWRDFTNPTVIAKGFVQVDWPERARGSLKGQSGGPVIAFAGERPCLVGLLRGASTTLRVSRFVPISAVRRVCPDLPRPWSFAGAGSVAHFTCRAYARQAGDPDVDLFRGRAAAVARVGERLRAAADGRPLVITGRPGAGKSSVLARAIIDQPEASGGGSLAFHARGATMDALLDAVADLCGVPQSSSLETLVEALSSRDGTGAADSVQIAVDALDEAAEGEPRKMAEALSALARVPRVRVAVACRLNRDVDGDDLLTLLNPPGGACDLVDLDGEYQDLPGLETAAAAMLAQTDVHEPSGAAWRAYRRDPELRARLARVIGDRAEGNYLVAALAALTLARADAPVDPADPGFDAREMIPSGVGEALNSYLNRFREAERTAMRGVLTALAYARGAGLTDDQWLLFVRALDPRRARHLDPEWMRSGPVADYLLTTGNSAEGATRRLFHRALDEELLPPEPKRSRDQQAIVETLLHVHGGGRDGAGWDTAPAYLIAHLAEHAAEATPGVLDRLIGDAEFLVHAEPASLLRALNRTARLEGTPEGRAVRDVYRTSAHHYRAGDSDDRGLLLEERRQLLAIDAARFRATTLLRGLSAPMPVRPRWASGAQASRALLWSLRGHDTGVSAIAATRLPDGRQVAVTGGLDGYLCFWDVRDGSQLRCPLPDGADIVQAVACVDVDGRSVAFTSGDDGMVTAWDLRTGALSERLTIRGHGAHTLGAAVIEDGPVLVCGSTAGPDGSAGSLRPSTLDTWRHLAGFPGSPDLMVACFQAGARKALAVLAGRGGGAQVWDLSAGVRRPSSIDGVTEVQAVACADLNGSPVAVTCHRNGPVQLWDLDSGEPLGPLGMDDERALAVACTRIGRVAIALTGHADGTIGVWNLAVRRRLETLVGHTTPVRQIACAQGDTASFLGDATDRPPFAISGDDDGTVRAWDLSAIGTIAGRPGRSGAAPITGGSRRQRRTPTSGSGTAAPAPHSGHSAEVSAVACVPGEPVVVSVAADTARCWDLASGEPRQPPAARRAPVTSVGRGVLGDEPVAVFGCAEGQVSVRRPAADAQPIVLSAPSGRISAVTCRGVARTTDGGGAPALRVAAADARGGLWVWDVPRAADTRIRDVPGAGPPSPRHLPPDPQRRGVITALTCGELDGRPVMIGARTDERAQVWWLDTLQTRTYLRGHSGAVNTVAFADLEGGPLVVTGGEDAHVRLWDLRNAEHLATLCHDGEVLAVLATTLGDHPVVISGGTDRHVMIWSVRDPSDPRLLHRIACPYPVTALDSAPGVLVVGSGREVILFELPASVTEAER